jgi:predicted dehydrogenase
MRIGIVGLGFMGKMHLANWSRCEGAQVTAICEQNPEALKDINKPVGNIAGRPAAIDVGQLHLYQNLTEMLRSERLEAVSITLPTHLHADTSIQAMEAGVHVLCEKPMALTITDCERMVEAARRTNRHLMIGHCIRFWPEYVKTKELIDSGQYGSLLSASFQRLGAAPTWGQNNWLMDARCSGGMVLDLHIHDTDFVQYLFGTPKAVNSCATLQDSTIRHLQTQYDYGDGRAICAEGSWLAAPSFGFQMSFTIMLQRATLVYDGTRQPAFRVCPTDGQAYSPPVGEDDAYAREIAYFASLIQGKNTPQVLTPEQSKESVRIIVAERRSALEGRKIRMEDI